MWLRGGGWPGPFSQLVFLGLRVFRVQSLFPWSPRVEVARPAVRGLGLLPLRGQLRHRRAAAAQASGQLQQALCGQVRARARVTVRIRVRVRVGGRLGVGARLGLRVD